MTGQSKPYKPKNYNDLAPYLLVDDVWTSLRFIEAVFGSPPLLVEKDENGEAIHAEARIGDSVIMIGWQPGSPDTMLHVYVPDAEETFRRAIAAGGSEIEAVHVKDGISQRGAVKDQSGTSWYFARMV